MKDTARIVTRFYIAAGIWLAVMVGAVAAVLGSMDVIYSAFEAAPEVRALTTMSIAIVVATGVAGAAWHRIRIIGRAEQVAHRVVADPRDDGSGAAHVPIA